MRALVAPGDLSALDGYQLHVQQTDGWVLGAALLAVVVLCCLFFSHPPKQPDTAAPSNTAGADAADAAHSSRTAASQKAAPQTVETNKAGSQAVRYVTVKDLAHVTGLAPEDAFLTSVAQHFRWCPANISGYTPIEEGVNAGPKAAAAAAGSIASRLLGGVTADSPGPAPVQLTAQQVKEQLELMAHGLISTGPISVVLKASWAAKFGPKTLVAIKILRDPFTNQQHNLKMFEYEVDVLSRCRHPNIIRIYGWCLEPPCVCILTELLPMSLHDRLYGPAGPLNSNPSSLPSSYHRSGLPAVSPSGNTASGSHDMHVGRSGPKGEPSSSRSAASDTRSHSSAGAGSVTSFLASPLSSGMMMDSTNSHTGMQAGDNHATGMHPPNTLPHLDVLKLACDIAAGLAHLHATPDARHTPPPSATTVETAAADGHNKAAPTSATSLPSEPMTATASSLHPMPGHMSPQRQALGASQLRERLERRESDVVLTPVTSSMLDLIVDDEDEEEPASGGRVLQRVVHRDLKPASILITSKGVAKISEFALAREHYSTTVFSDGVRHPDNQRAGTLRYMAPELLSGQAYVRITDKIDIYSFSVLLWELGLSRRPWSHCSDIQVAQMVQEGKRPPLPSNTSTSGGVMKPGSTRLAASQSSVAAHLRAMPSQLDMNELPADCVFRKVPKYEALVRSCWQPTAQRRPKAFVLHNHLLRLLEKQTAESRKK